MTRRRPTATEEPEQEQTEQTEHPDSEFPIPNRDCLRYLLLKNPPSVMDFSRQKAQKAQILPSRPAERGESRREGFPFLSLLRLFAAMPIRQSAMQPVALLDCAFVPHADYSTIAPNFCQGLGSEKVTPRSGNPELPADHAD